MIGEWCLVDRYTPTIDRFESILPCVVIPCFEEFILDGLGWGGVIHSTKGDVVMDMVSVLGLVTLYVVVVVSVICELLNLSPSSTFLHVSEGLGEPWVYVREHLI